MILEWLLYAGVLALCVALHVRALMRRIARLEEEIARLARGDHDVVRRDEMRDVVADYNRVAQRLRERIDSHEDAMHGGGPYR
jgi:methyl-accepting chemotaxis protein